MRRVALCALASVVALGVAGSGGPARRLYGSIFIRQPQGAAYHHIVASYVRIVNAGFLNPRPVGPFVSNGAFVSLGADSIDMGDGQITSCVPGERYAQAVDLRNRSKDAVVVISATGQPEGPLSVIHHIATQVRLEPRPRSMGGGITYMWHWSAARTQPVTIPAGRSAIVQSDFRMAHCEDLARWGTIVLPGEVFLKYQTGGGTDIEPVVVPQARTILMQGAAERSCGPRVAGGSANIVAANMSCRVARRAAVACRRLWDGGTCKSDGRVWDCVAGQSCWLPGNKSHWFTVTSRRGA